MFGRAQQQVPEFVRSCVAEQVTEFPGGIARQLVHSSV